MKDAAQFAFILLLAVLVSSQLVIADSEKPEAELSPTPGEIKVGAKPPGLIAFISGGDIWVMDTDGKNRQQVTDVDNAKGRLSFSPDNRVIAFSREGKDANSLPTGEGGMHLLHDIFLAYIDSATTRPNWWKRVTFDLGSFHPDWSPDGKYIYCQRDINAGYVDYIAPSHQIARVEVESGNSEYLRNDWQVCKTSMLMPSATGDGKRVAFVSRYSLDPDKLSFQNMGVRIVPMDSITMPENEIRKTSVALRKAFAPSWSPDGQWLAYIDIDMRSPGVYIVKADESEKRLVFAPTMTQQPLTNPVGWSPDSKWIVFAVTDGVIYTVDINGDNLTPLTGSGQHSCPTWSK